MRKRFGLAAFCLFFIAGNTFAKDQDFKFLQSLSATKYHQVHSLTLEQPYHVFVLGPEKPEEGKKYPTLYLLDGGITYPLLASYYNYLRLAEEVPEMIIVGVSYGTNDWQKGNMRSRDFTAKAVERSFWGGAPGFLTFFKTELFPMIEGHYPSDPEQRLIFGQSLGGQFVLYVAQTNPTLFDGYIASNPALHRNLDFFLGANPGGHNHNDLPRLFVSSGSNDDLRFREPVGKWFQFWNGQETPPWLLKTTTLEGQGHFSAAPESFRQGLHWIFKED